MIKKLASIACLLALTASTFFYLGRRYAAQDVENNSDCRGQCGPPEVAYEDLPEPMKAEVRSAVQSAIGGTANENYSTLSDNLKLPFERDLVARVDDFLPRTPEGATPVVRSGGLFVSIFVPPRFKAADVSFGIGNDYVVVYTRTTCDISEPLAFLGRVKITPHGAKHSSNTLVYHGEHWVEAARPGKGN